MDVFIKQSSIQFRNPVPGQPTRKVAEHYIGRRVTALVDGIERMFRFEPSEVPFEASVEDLENAVRAAI